MSETVETPVEQVQTPPQQANTPPPPQEDYKRRYDGAILKIQELTERNRALEAQLADQSSQLEQLKTQLGQKDVEKTLAVGERDKQLQEALTQKQELEARVADLQALQLKVEVARELGRPELVNIADRFPNLTDRDQLKTVMQDLAKWADDLVGAREKQLLAGVTATGGGSGGVTPAAPTNAKAWDEYIEGLPLGSPERSKALDEYGDWLWRQNNR